MDAPARKRLQTVVVVVCVVVVAIAMIAGFGDDSDSEYVVVGAVMAFLGIWSWITDRRRKRD
ncbi:LPXTG cell wall anchor domain-containing protein [Dactylosporangium aurantiacum]|uniref:LPXTG cell wall anchor domain-containing protein n=1 Tax=Dactylosporangium aurantiacum TaxID=35754 RepID=A0A9Q9I8N5_9ACTN|nr:LPXTG cell wall anchor domain-containing protein [Dactylosporangium aurantiacum]MDG6107879.1 LPXTG cell wall anchor domain-containing protein [Dactylosporangium aurantiacum]UWZ51809.1 LPXTG cell wall anchor domain-containing protein [Dactylosporangium aurantiacum]